MMDLADHIERRKLAALILADIDRYCVEALQDGPREHLGASVIGEPCYAKLWNDFRWLKQEQFEGRILRLFERGKLEESRFVKLLTGVGFEVRELADNGEQWRMSGCNNHFGGSLDAIAKPPARYDVPNDLILPNEYKTHGEKSFSDLVKNGVRVSKPMHYAQLCCYGRAYGYRYGLYLAVNKNTDHLWPEIVPLDWDLADTLYRKADSVIHAKEQPPKIAQVATFYTCKTCVHSGICHNGELPEKNCRSCKFAVPVERGEWACTNDNSIFSTERTCYTLDQDTIKAGCDQWSAIINGERQ